MIDNDDDVIDNTDIQVVDNWSKSSSNATFITNLAKSGGLYMYLYKYTYMHLIFVCLCFYYHQSYRHCTDAIKQVLFVSSAGMYKSSNSIPVIETDSTKVLIIYSLC